MTAPALVALGCGPLDARAARMIREIVAETRRLRPDLRLEAAFTSGSKTTVETAVGNLSRRHHREVVVVPLRLSPSEQVEMEVLTAVDAAVQAFPDVQVRATDPIGADPGLLTVLDLRLREALRFARIRELDALVLAANGSTDPRFASALQRLARLWSNHHHLPTSIAFANTTPPSAGEAVRELRRQGKRHVAVGSMFLTGGLEAERARELALEAGACAVSEPLGSHPEVSRLLVSRYFVGALELVPV